MGVIESIKNAFRSGEAGSTAAFRCEFCDEEFETAYSICPSCGSEKVEPLGPQD